MASTREAYEMGNGPNGPHDLGPMYRRTAFPGQAPELRPMPSKAPVMPQHRIRPSVGEDVARVAEFLCSDTVTQGIFQQLRDEAVAKLTASPVGAKGQDAREIARYELEAISTIEERLRGMAAEIRLFSEPENPGAE